MSVEIVTLVRQKYPTPLGETHRAFLDEVACALKLGLVHKTTGTFIPYPAPVHGVSQDALMARDGRAWDILQDGEGQANPAFHAIEPIDISRYVEPAGAPAVASGDGSSAPPDPDAAALELARLRTLVERLCRHLGVSTEI